MKHFVWTVAALLVGLIVGSLGPRSELAHVREQLAEAKASRPAPRLDRLQEMVRFQSSPNASRRRTKTSSVRDSKRSARRSSGESSDDPDVIEVEEEENPAEDSLEAREERLMDAIELWQTRSALARASFVSNAELSEEQALHFDVMIEAMNLRLAKVIEDYAVMFKEGESLTPEVGVRMMHELSEIMVVTYNDFEETLPSGWRDSGDKVFDLGDYIDPSVAAPLLSVPGAFDGRWRQP